MQSSSGHRWILTLVLAGVMASAMVPKGYMPGLSESGTPTLVICSTGPSTGITKPTDDPENSVPTCDFQPLQWLALPESEPVSNLAPWDIQHPSGYAVDLSASDRVTHLARGPPHSV